MLAILFTAMTDHDTSARARDKLTWLLVPLSPPNYVMWTRMVMTDYEALNP